MNGRFIKSTLWATVLMVAPLCGMERKEEERKRPPGTDSKKMTEKIVRQKASFPPEFLVNTVLTPAGLQLFQIGPEEVDDAGNNILHRVCQESPLNTETQQVAGALISAGFHFTKPRNAAGLSPRDILTTKGLEAFNKSKQDQISKLVELTDVCLIAESERHRRNRPTSPRRQRGQGGEVPLAADAGDAQQTRPRRSRLSVQLPLAGGSGT